MSLTWKCDKCGKEFWHIKTIWGIKGLYEIMFRSYESIHHHDSPTSSGIHICENCLPKLEAWLKNQNP